MAENDIDDFDLPFISFSIFYVQ